MTSDPWRPQSVADAMLGRDTTPLPPVLGDGWENIEDFDVEADEVYFIWSQPRQAVFWPMILHRHTNECGRA